MASAVSTCTVEGEISESLSPEMNRDNLAIKTERDATFLPIKMEEENDEKFEYSNRYINSGETVHDEVMESFIEYKSDPAITIKNEIKIKYEDNILTSDLKESLTELEDQKYSPRADTQHKVDIMEHKFGCSDNNLLHSRAFGYHNQQSSSISKRVKASVSGMVFQCDNCSITFSSCIYKDRHQKLYCNKNLHTEDMERKHTCYECGRRFKWTSNLKAHMLIHGRTKPYSCEICGKKFTRKSDLDSHMNFVHYKNKKYVCETCNKRFTGIGNLTAHKRIHIGVKPYKCEICYKCFTLNANLKDHIRIHTGEKPHVCTECRKSFSQHSSLKTHMRLHSCEKPYHCSECDTSFTHLITLKRHIMLHSGEKPYSCSYCDAKFSRTDRKNEHMKKKHAKKYS